MTEQNDLPATDAERKVIKGDLPATEVFTATLQLRSVGNRPNIIPEVYWSHGIEGDMVERAEANQLPYSFIAMSQIVASIAQQMTPLHPMDEAQLPEDSDEAALVLDAMAEFNENGGKAN